MCFIHYIKILLEKRYSESKLQGVCVSASYIYRVITRCFRNRLMEVSGFASKRDCLDLKGKYVIAYKPYDLYGSECKAKQPGSVSPIWIGARGKRIAQVSLTSIRETASSVYMGSVYQGFCNDLWEQVLRLRKYSNQTSREQKRTEKSTCSLLMSVI